jgi:hypothetical protein
VNRWATVGNWWRHYSSQWGYESKYIRHAPDPVSEFEQNAKEARRWWWKRRRRKLRTRKPGAGLLSSVTRSDNIIGFGLMWICYTLLPLSHKWLQLAVWFLLLPCLPYLLPTPSLSSSYFLRALVTDWLIGSGVFLIYCFSYPAESYNISNTFWVLSMHLLPGYWWSCAVA